MGTTEKVSLTLGHRELRLAKAVAGRAGMSLSAFVNAAVQRHATELARELERQRAAREIIATFPARALPTPEDDEEFRELLANAAPPPSEAEIEALLAGSSRISRKPSKKRRR